MDFMTMMQTRKSIRSYEDKPVAREDLIKIAEQKMPDLNAASVEAAASMVAGTARSMGVVIVD